jgi:hypothetical protein
VGAELRPDKCGVIFEKAAEGVMLATITGDMNKYISGQIRSFKQQGYQVRVRK